MAKAVETGMPKAKMRKLLMRSKAKPVKCAVGIGEDVTCGLLLMKVNGAPRKLMKDLEEEFPKAKNLRFGTAFVLEDEPKLVNLQINRHAPGIARKLIKTLKGTGFNKVRIVTDEGEVDEFEEKDDTPQVADEPDDGLDAAEEGEDEADDGAETAGAGATAPAAAPATPVDDPALGRDERVAALGKVLAGLAASIPGKTGGDEARKAALLKLAKDANIRLQTNNFKSAGELIGQLKAELDAIAPPPPDAPPPPPPGASAADREKQARSLASALAELAPTIPGRTGTDEVRKAALLKLAREANANIKAGNLGAATDMVAQLRAGLADGAAVAPAKVDPAKLDQIRVHWDGMRQQVAADVASLRDALEAAYGAQDVGREVMSRFDGKASPVIARFDARLDAALSAVVKAADPADQSARVKEAKDVVKDYLSFAMTDPFITDMDGNPFVKLAIREKATAALAAVAKQLV